MQSHPFTVPLPAVPIDEPATRPGGLRRPEPDPEIETEEPERWDGLS